MKLAGIAPAGIVDAILDHGGPIANSKPISGFCLEIEVLG